MIFRITNWRPLAGFCRNAVFITRHLSLPRCNSWWRFTAICAASGEASFSLEVLDRGPGIAPGDERRVFDRFQRGRDAPAGGVGLGLPICKGIVEAHGGHIAAEAREGGGARLRIVLPIVGVAALVVAGTSAAQPARAPAPAKPAEKVVLQGVTAWVKTFPFNDGYFEFERRLAQKSGGTLTVTWKGGPEVVPPFEQAAAMRKGVFDLLNTTGSYYTQLVPEAPMFDLLDGPMAPIRAAGVVEEFDRVNQKQGVKFLGSTSGNVAFGLFLKKPAKTIDDFKGLKIRSIPIYLPLIERLGASPVTMAPAEVYPALERGVVDGFGWPWAQVEPQRLYEVSKYIVEPGFFTVREVLIMNLATWNRLSAEHKKLLAETIVEVERWADTHFKKLYVAEVDRLINRHGMVVNRLPEDQAKRYRESAYKGAWDRFVAAAPENGPMIREKVTPFSRPWPPQGYHVFKPY